MTNLFPQSGEIRSTGVSKTLQVDFDLGNLMVSDPNDLDLKELRSNKSTHLQNLTRSNTQLLFNRIWELEFQRVDDVVVAQLPKPTFLLPREKPAPGPKQLTKWQQYAKDKGVVKKKKTKLVWDEIVNGWVPRFGYRRAAAEHEKDWVLEVPGNANPYEDQFEKKTEAKSERVAKNELQRLKNIARGRNVKIPGMGISSKEVSGKELHKAMHVAKAATASLGQFQPKLPKEKPLRNTGKKRTFESLIQPNGQERTRNLEVLNKIMNKKPKLNVDSVAEKRVQVEVEKEAKPKRQKNTKQKRGSARSGSFKKGRSSARSKPKKKTH